MSNVNTAEWVANRIKDDEITKYMDNGKSFIDADLIHKQVAEAKAPDAKELDDIIEKALSITTLEPHETASLLAIKDESVWQRLYEVAGEVKKKVYDNRIVTFAPLYTSNLCVNNCAYCSFRDENNEAVRRRLTPDEIKRETETLVGDVGHKRLIVVYGEHPKSGVEYMIDSINAIYDVEVKKRGRGIGIRRVNINAAPLQIDELRQLKKPGIGTFQVFQETYHQPTYASLHPSNTLKGHYLWRLYALHRSMEAGVDDVGLGALFGLYDWRFEVLSLLYHSRDLEAKFGVGPHTISFPRIEPAHNTPFVDSSKYAVSDDDFKKIVTVIRLSVPHTGMILTARENAQMRRNLIPLGCTQTDASTKIGVGAYSELGEKQVADRQQFILGDNRSLDEVVRELAQMGYITSFCTAGYRCGRTGENIMELLKCGKEGMFCKLNAIITFREWLDDFASPETLAVGEPLIQKELEETKRVYPMLFEELKAYYDRTVSGERDLYF